MGGGVGSWNTEGLELLGARLAYLSCTQSQALGSQAMAPGCRGAWKEPRAGVASSEA